MAAEGDLESVVDVGADADLDADLLELLRIMPRVIRAMKRQRPDQESEPPAAIRALLSAGALGPRHLPVIVVLSMQGTMTVSELARRVGVGVAATSLMVGELAKAGIVERHVDERDRRRTIVSISEGLRADWREGTSSTAVFWCLRTMETWGTMMGWDTVSNVVKEFWPDIRRKVHQRKE